MTETNNQTDRPDWHEGILTYDGKEYHFFSGGNVSSMPYGTYGPLYKPTHPDVQRSYDHHDAVQWAQPNEIWDPKYQVMLEDQYGYGMAKQVMGADKVTNGCFAIKRQEWPELTKKLWAAIDRDEKLYIHVTPSGASIDSNK